MSSRYSIHLSILILLGAALALGYGASEQRSADTIGLERLSTTAGAWTCTDQKVPGEPGAESRRVLRTYRRSDGRQVEAILEATWTRLGALRDWTVALSAQGWIAQPRQARQLRMTGAQPFPFTASLQAMQKGNLLTDTMVWFTTTDTDAATLVQAETAAWKKRLFGRAKPWCEMYLTTERKGAEDTAAQTALEELASELAPQLMQLMSEAVHAGQHKAHSPGPHRPMKDT